MENLGIQENVIIIYSSYTESQKRAIQKYRLKNKEKINELNKKYYENKKLNDPDFFKSKVTVEQDQTYVYAQISGRWILLGHLLWF